MIHALLVTTAYRPGSGAARAGVAGRPPGSNLQLSRAAMPAATLSEWAPTNTHVTAFFARSVPVPPTVTRPASSSGGWIRVPVVFSAAPAGRLGMTQWNNLCQATVAPSESCPAEPGPTACSASDSEYLPSAFRVTGKLAAERPGPQLRLVRY